MWIAVPRFFYGIMKTKENHRILSFCVALLCAIFSNAHQPDNLHGFGIDALRAGHVFVVARCADSAPKLCAKKPVQNAYHDSAENKGNKYRAGDFAQAQKTQ